MSSRVKVILVLFTLFIGRSLIGNGQPTIDTVSCSSAHCTLDDCSTVFDGFKSTPEAERLAVITEQRDRCVNETRHQLQQCQNELVTMSQENDQ